MRQKSSKITDFLALTVFAVFAVCLLAVLLTGAGIYRNLTEKGAEDCNRRTAAMYLTTRVRQSQTLTVEGFGGCDALTIREEIAGETYLTRIYCHGGFLRELFCAEGADLSPEDGEKILQADALFLSVEGDLLTAHLDDTELTFFLRTGKEAAP